MKETDFCLFMQQYEKLVYTVCWQFTKNHHTAQDLAQDTFVSAYTHWDSRPPENEKAWVCRIATNKAKDHLKCAYSRKVQPGMDTEPPAGQVMFIAQPSPEEVVAQKEGWQQAEACIQGLKEPYRQVAELHLLEGYSAKEIAGGLARPLKTVQTQLYRAKLLLRQSLAPAYGAGG